MKVGISVYGHSKFESCIKPVRNCGEDKLDSVFVVVCVDAVVYVLYSILELR